MTATLFVRHPVTDFDTWLGAYNAAESIRVAHGCTAKSVHQAPADANDVMVVHELPTLDQAQAFADDPALKDAMMAGGVAGPPRFEIFASA